MILHPLAPAAEIEAARRLTLARSLPPTALAALDEITRPMTVREIERALRGVVPKAQRAAVATALRGVAIVMITPKENDQ